MRIPTIHEAHRTYPWMDAVAHAIVEENTVIKQQQHIGYTLGRRALGGWCVSPLPLVPSATTSLLSRQQQQPVGRSNKGRPLPILGWGRVAPCLKSAQLMRYLDAPSRDRAEIIRPRLYECWFGFWWRVREMGPSPLGTYRASGRQTPPPVRAVFYVLCMRTSHVHL